MKNIKQFFKWKYLKFCLLFAINMAVCLFFAISNSEYCYASGETWNLYAMWLFRIYPFVYGAISYVITRRIGTPNVIYGISIMLSFLLCWLCVMNTAAIGLAALGSISIIVSQIISLLTAGAVNIFNLKKIRMLFNARFFKPLTLFMLDMVVYVVLIVVMVKSDEVLDSVFRGVGVMCVIYPIIHGIISYVLTQKIGPPHVLYVLSIVLSAIIALIYGLNDDYALVILIVGGASVIVSQTVSFLTFLIVKLFNLMLIPDPKYME